MSWVAGLLNLLIMIPRLESWVETLAASIVDWYVARQGRAALSAIADAAATAARAETEQERIDAAFKWRDALSLPRVERL